MPGLHCRAGEGQGGVIWRIPGFASYRFPLQMSSLHNSMAKGTGVELFVSESQSIINQGDRHGKQRQEERIKGQKTATQAGTGREVTGRLGSASKWF